MPTENETLKTLVTELEKKKEELNKIKVGNLQKLDEQISSMMTKTANKNHRREHLYACNTCGKEYKHSHMKEHIEAIHLEGISAPCDFCEKIFRSRSGLRDHNRKYHRTRGH